MFSGPAVPCALLIPLGTAGNVPFEGSEATDYRGLSVGPLPWFLHFHE